MKRTVVYLLTLLTIGWSTQLSAQSNGGSRHAVYGIAFYNVENLFDTEDDPNNRGDDEFLPSAAYNWTPQKYDRKLHNIAYVFSQLCRDITPVGPAVIGVAEVENRRVLEDLAARPEIRDMNLKVIHEESPDWRGIDVALFYNPTLFEVTSHSTHKFEWPDSTFRTRDQLLVTGKLAGEEVHIIVNHWPSRYGSKSTTLREAAAAGVNKIVDSLYTVNPRAKVIVMGDLNDDPINISIREVLKAHKTQKEVDHLRGMFNPMWLFYEKGIGTLAYQGKWSLFDQIIITAPLLKKFQEDPNELVYWKTEIFNRDFLITKEGKNKGYPLRTFSNNNFIRGYADHLPVYIYLTKRLAD